MKRKDGTIIDTYNTVTVLDRKKGWREGVVSTVMDITKRKRAMEALQQREEQYRTLVEGINDIIFRVDANDVFTYMSPVAKKLGYDPEELIGRQFNDIVYEDDLERVKIRHVELINGIVRPFEYRITSKSGEPVWVRSSSRALFEDSRFTGIQGVVTIITKEKRLKAQLQRAQKMEAIGTLAGGIAHDFNNILSAMIGYTDLALLETPKGSSLHNNLLQVHVAGNRAKELVRQILAVSRHEDRSKHPVLINPLVKEALKMLRSSIPSSIEIREHVTDEPLTLLADPTQVHQVIVNLATNAMQAMADQEGLLKIRLDAVTFTETEREWNPELAPGPYTRLRVSDTGVGIPEDQLDKIFEPYFTTKDPGKGSGLGLAMVHGIVKSHDGHIDVFSKPGQGTTFRIYLPLTSTEPEKAPPQKDESLPTGSERILKATE